MSQLNINSVNFKILNNDELMNLSEDEVNLLNKRFRLFSKENILKHSKWIFLHKEEFAPKNIIGFMELNRYLVTDNATMSDKKEVYFDIFNDRDLIYLNIDNENVEFSRLDSFIVINNVEILNELRREGLGKMLYKYLEENILTEEDILMEVTRTIDGRTCNLLKRIEKVPTFTNITDLYDSLF